MKRYALFAGPWYYPSGGWGDFVETYDTLEEAKSRAAAVPADNENYRSSTWFHIVDVTAGKIVCKGQFDSLTGKSTLDGDVS